MKEKKKKLSQRVVAYCSALAAALCLILGVLGYWIYYENAMKSYKMYIESTLSIVNSMIDADDMRRCLEDLRISDTYQETQLLLDDIKTNTMVEYIYLIEPLDESNPQAVRYVCIAYTEEERLYEPEDIIEIGEPVQADAFSEEMLQVFHDTMFGGAGISYVSNSAGFGNMLTGTRPLKDSEGNTVCLICVDFSMEAIAHTLYEYLFVVLAGTLVTALAALVVIIRRINKTIVEPVRRMAEAAEDFVVQSQTVKDPEKLAYRNVSVKKKDEIRVLSESISHMMADMVSYMRNLTKTAAERERMLAEVNAAAQIQTSMLPGRYPAFPERTEFDIYGKLRLAGQMGGAFFDYFLVDASHLGILAGDMDHTGIPAALMLVIARTIIRNLCRLGYAPDKVFHETNNQLNDSNETAGMKITAFLGILNLETGVLEYVNAGHPAPLLKKAGGGFRPLSARPCFALASMANVPYFKQEVKLVQGDLLVLYTQGLTEAKDRRKEPYSETRLTETMGELAGQVYEVTELQEALEQDVLAYMDGAAQEQDMGMVMMRYLGR